MSDKGEKRRVLVNYPPLSQAESNAAWEVHEWFTEHCRRTGQAPQPDPIRSCLKVAYTWFCTEHMRGGGSETDAH